MRGGTRWADYLQGDAMMAGPFADGTRARAGRPRELFHARIAPASFGAPNYDVSMDGRFLVVETQESASPTRLHVVVNWAGTLKQRAPG